MNFIDFVGFIVVYIVGGIVVLVVVILFKLRWFWFGYDFWEDLEMDEGLEVFFF